MENEKRFPNKDISRRKFLTGIGVGSVALAGVGMLGCDQSSDQKETGKSDTTDSKDTSASSQKDEEALDTVQNLAATEPAQTKELSCDVLVLGAGIAGMSAAVEAAEAGASVVVFDKMKRIGGDSSICSGNFYCVGSKTQDEMGYTDYGTTDELAQFYFEKSDEDANMEMCTLVAEKGGEGLDWLVDHGCEFEKKPGEDVSDRSMISSNSGEGIINALQASAEEAGVEIYTETRAVSLTKDGDTVVGAVARNDDTEIQVSCNAVILATGGFDGQDWSKSLYAPGTVGWHSFSSAGNTGDGIELARDAGAMLLLKGGLSQIHLVGHSPLALNDELSALRIINNGCYVTDLGYRCANESMDSQFDYFPSFVKTGRNKLYIVCDSKADKMDLLEKGVTEGVVHKADTLREAADSAGLPWYPTQKTIDRYNELAKNGVDEDFGKDPEHLQPITDAPFYVVEITPNTNDSFGAVPISLKSEVLDEDRNPIPGFYAAGTIANPELFFMRYAVSGASLCMGTVTGRIAGAEAAAL